MTVANSVTPLPTTESDCVAHTIKNVRQPCGGGVYGIVVIAFLQPAVETAPEGPCGHKVRLRGLARVWERPAKAGLVAARPSGANSFARLNLPHTSISQQICFELRGEVGEAAAPERV